MALGNTGTAADLGVIAGYLGHPDPLLRRHAAWAAGRIGGLAARRILESALIHESEHHVVEEISAALTLTIDSAVYAEPTDGPRGRRSTSE